MSCFFGGVSFARWGSLNWIILWSIGPLILLTNQDAIPAANLLIGLEANSSSMCVEQLCSEDQLWSSTNSRQHSPRHVNKLSQKPRDDHCFHGSSLHANKNKPGLYLGVFNYWRRFSSDCDKRSVLMQRMLKATKSVSLNLFDELH